MWYTEDLHNNITEIFCIPHTFYMLFFYGDLLYTTYILHIKLIWRSSVYHIHSTCYVVMEIFCIPRTFYMLCSYGDLLCITYILHVMLLWRSAVYVECMWYTEDLHKNITCRIYVVYRRSP
jgi:hypothetical protein